jgi:hypothetical protein
MKEVVFNAPNNLPVQVGVVKGLKHMASIKNGGPLDGEKDGNHSKSSWLLSVSNL